MLTVTTPGPSTCSPGGAFVEARCAGQVAVSKTITNTTAVWNTYKGLCQWSYTNYDTGSVDLCKARGR